MIKKTPTYYNPYTFNFFNIYVVGQSDQQNNKIGQEILYPPPSLGQGNPYPPPSTCTDIEAALSTY